MQHFLLALLFSLSFAEEGIKCTKSLVNTNYAPTDDSDPAAYWHCSTEGSISILTRCKEGHIYDRKHGDCILGHADFRSKRSSSNAKELDLLQMEAIVNDQNLGAIYNARDNTFIAGSYLWNPEEGQTIAENMVEQDMTYSNLEITTSDNTLDRTNLLNIDASLSVTVLAGKVTVTGAAKYLQDEKRSSKTARVVLSYKSTTKSQTMPLNIPLDHPEVCAEAAKENGPTHVVTSIVRGLRANIVFDKVTENDESKSEISGKLHVVINSIPNFSADGKIDVDILGNSSDITESLNVYYYADTTIGAPSTYEEAVTTLSQIQEEAKNGNARIRYQLTPLSYLCDTTTAVLQDIREGLVNTALKILSNLGEIQQSLNALQGTIVYNILEPVKRNLATFDSKFNSYESVFKRNLAEKLKRIKSGLGGEVELSQLISDHESSAFQYDKAMAYLESRNREISTLNLILEDMDEANNDFGTDIFEVAIFSEGNDIDCTLRANYKYWFDVNVLSKTDADSEYGSTVVDDSKLWYNDINAVGKVGGMLKAFLQFGKSTVSHSKSKKEQFCFLIRIKELEEDVEGTDYMNVKYHFRKPNSVHTGDGENFVPPGAPPKPICAPLYNGFEIPTVETDNQFVTEMWAEFKVEGVDAEQTVKSALSEPDMVIRTLQPNTEYIVSTKYKVLDSRVHDVGFGPSSETITCVTAPASPLTNIQISFPWWKNSNGIRLSWDGPTDVIDYDKISHVIEVRKHGDTRGEASYIETFKKINPNIHTFYDLHYFHALSLYDISIYITSDEGRSAVTTTTFCTGPDVLPLPEVTALTEDSVQIVERLSLLRVPKGFTATKLTINYVKLNIDGSTGSEQLTQELVLDSDNQGDQTITLTGLEAGRTYTVSVTLSSTYGDHAQEMADVTSESIDVKPPAEGTASQQQTDEFNTLKATLQADAQAAMGRAIGLKSTADNLALSINNDNLQEDREIAGAAKDSVPTKLVNQKDILAGIARKSCIDTGMDYQTSEYHDFQTFTTTWNECLNQCKTSDRTCNSVSWNKLAGHCYGRTKRRGDKTAVAQNWWGINLVCLDSMTGDHSKLTSCVKSGKSLSFSDSSSFTSVDVMTSIWDCWYWCLNTNECNGATFDSANKTCKIGSVTSVQSQSGWESVQLDCMSAQETIIYDGDGNRIDDGGNDYYIVDGGGSGGGGGYNIISY